MRKISLFLIYFLYKEIKKDQGQSHICVKYGLPNISEEIHEYLVIYDETVSHISYLTLQPISSKFLLLYLTV